jgi:anti-sigma28 factor (negative regulator of flagellin synthesis)
MTLRLNTDQVMEHEWVTESNGQCTSSVRQLVRSAANTLNPEETQQHATEQWDEPDTTDTLVTEMNALKQKIYEGNYETVRLADKLLTDGKDQGTSSVGQLV